jgi:nucleotide-binding universal stress UspA family protein
VKRILVALDASERAPAVLAAAARLAELGDAKLIVFRAIGIPVDLPRDLLSMPAPRLDDRLLAHARADLERLAGTIEPQLVERVTAELGTAWDAIVREARRAEVDLIVIGSHGFGGLDRLLGTTAARVVNHADRNVLVVRTPL